MASPDTIWHKESLKLKEIFGMREGFDICPNKFFHRLIKAPPCTPHAPFAEENSASSCHQLTKPDTLGDLKCPPPTASNALGAASSSDGIGLPRG